MIEQEPSRRLEELIRERARLDVELERFKELVTVLLWTSWDPLAFTTSMVMSPAW
jgi:hypothetical protein